MKIQEKLNRNITALKSRFSSNEVEFKVLPESIVISGVKPVLIKACLEKMIKDGEIDKGTVTQYDDCVEYESTGNIKFYDNHYPINEKQTI